MPLHPIENERRKYAFTRRFDSYSVANNALVAFWREFHLNWAFLQGQNLQLYSLYLWSVDWTPPAACSRWAWNPQLGFVWESGSVILCNSMMKRDKEEKRKMWNLRWVDRQKIWCQFCSKILFYTIRNQTVALLKLQDSQLCQKSILLSKSPIVDHPCN